MPLNIIPYKKTNILKRLKSLCIVSGLSLFFLFNTFFEINAQNIPIINPGLTNSFLYNPSLAGSSSSALGSLAFIHKESFTDVQGHPVSDIVSMHVPVNNYDFGIGLNFFMDRVNAMQTIYGSFSYAYHFKFDRNKKLSLGLSGNISQNQLDFSKVKVLYIDQNDQVINEYINDNYIMDFSLGFNYQVKGLTLAGTVNNLGSSGLFHKKYNTALLDYYSAFIKYEIPVNFKQNQLEPYFSYRQLPLAPVKCNLGCNYHYSMCNSLQKTNDRYFTVGFAMGNNLDMSFLMGVDLLKRIHFMYNYEMLGKFNSVVGNFNEIIVQYNFIDMSYYEKNTEYLVWDNRKLNRKRKF